MPVPAFGVEGIDQGQGIGGQQGRADSLRHPGDEKEPDAVRGRTDDREHQIDRQSREQHLTPPEDVSHASRQQKKSSEGERVSADDPGQGGGRKTKRIPQGGDCHIGAREVVGDESCDEARDEKRNLAVLQGRGVSGGRW